MPQFDQARKCATGKGIPLDVACRPFPSGTDQLCGRMGLRVASLSCHRSGRKVLDAVTLSAEPGEAILLRGPNGVGKSTLLRALCGLVRCEGTIVLDGIDLVRDPDRYLDQIAYAGHLDAVKAQLSVAENLRFCAALAGVPSIDAALDAFDLATIADWPAHSCSAGQKRRLGLARLALGARRLWLLDEPTVSLDAPSVARLCSVLTAHSMQGGIALIATHVDLLLPKVRDIRLAPVRPDRERVTDPFIAGRWA